MTRNSMWVTNFRSIKISISKFSWFKTQICSQNKWLSCNNCISQSPWSCVEVKCLDFSFIWKLNCKNEFKKFISIIRKWSNSLIFCDSIWWICSIDHHIMQIKGEIKRCVLAVFEGSYFNCGNSSCIIDIGILLDHSMSINIVLWDHFCSVSVWVRKLEDWCIGIWCEFSFLLVILK